MNDEKYSIELYSRAGILLADISPYVKSLSYSMQRNEAEDLLIRIDLNAYEDLCKSIGTNPLSILGPYQTDIKIKRNDQYLFGTHVGSLNMSLDENDMEIEIRAFGYLNLLIDRYVSPLPFIGVDATEIAWALIEETQSQENGDLGITKGSQQATTVYRDRNYEPRQNVKSGIINLTSLRDGNFDVEIDYNREYKTYNAIGSDRSNEIEFIYPGNIKSVTIPRQGLSLFNKVYGIGSGFGLEAITSELNDVNSQLNYGLHEKIENFNSVKYQDTLDDNTYARLLASKDLLEIPQMVVSGEDFDLSSYSIGDRVTVRIDNHPFLSTINGVYRIEKIDVAVDQNGSEEIRIYFDNNNIELINDDYYE